MKLLSRQGHKKEADVGSGSTTQAQTSRRVEQNKRRKSQFPSIGCVVNMVSIVMVHLEWHDNRAGSAIAAT